MPVTNATPPSSFLDRLKPLCLNIQFVWALGHFVTFFYTCLYIIYRSSPEGSHLFYKALYGALLSYLLVFYKTHGKIEFTKEFVSRVFMDENTQYLFLGIYWVTSKSFSGTFDFYFHEFYKKII